MEILINTSEIMITFSKYKIVSLFLHQNNYKLILLTEYE
jgi:hypothetical protein